MKRIILILCLVLVISSFLGADIYVKNMKKTGPFEIMGKKVPENMETEEQWLGKNKFAISSGKGKFIADFQEEKFYIVIPNLKQYFQVPTTIDKAKLKKLLPPKAFEILTSIQITGVKVNLNLGKKKVSNWNCNGSELEMVFMIPALNVMPKIKIRMWTTEDVPFDYKSYTGGLEKLFQKVFLGIFTIDEDSKKELEKLNRVAGFNVASEVSISIFGSEIGAVTQCLEVVEKPAPAGTYSVPAGYTQAIIPGLQQQK